MGFDHNRFTIRRSPESNQGEKSMRNTTLAGLLAAPLMVFMLGLPARAADAGAPTTCKDGTTSMATGRGACSGHGGVQKPSKSKPALDAPTSAPATAATAATPAAAAPAAAAPAAAKSSTVSKSAPTA